MNNFPEAEKLYLIEGDLEGFTGWADEDDEEDKTTSAEAREMIKKVFQIGSERLLELEKHIEPSSSGNFYVPNCSTGHYADFHQQANLKHFKAKYPWLHEFDQQIGLDPDKAGKLSGDFERLLAKVPTMDWEQFLEDVDYVKHNYEIDDGEANELEMKEQNRWMEEDGVGDLRTALLENATDSFSAFVFSRVNAGVAWEACRFSENYPEGDGQGGVYLDMEVLAKDEETRDFILEQMKPEMFRTRWEKIKRLTFETRGVGSAFTEAVKKHLLIDPEAARLYNNMSAAQFYGFFQQAIPDSAYRDDARAYWYQFRDYNFTGGGRVERKWTVGRRMEFDDFHKEARPTKHEKPVMLDALDDLMALPATMALFKRAGHREPPEHPELPLESLQEAVGDEDELNPEQPEQPELIPFDPAEYEPKPPTGEEAFKAELDEPDVDYIKTKGHLRVDRVYSDQHIDVVQPRDDETLTAIAPKQAFSFSHIDLGRFYIVRRARTFEFLAVFAEYPSELQYWHNTWHTFTSTSLNSLPEGKSIKKWLEQRYTELAQEDGDKMVILYQVGGVRAIQRLEKITGETYSQYETAMGIAAGQLGKLDNAVRFFRHSNPVHAIARSDVDKKGVWIPFKDWDEFIPLFGKREREQDHARAAIDGETYDWFDHLWEQKPSVESMLPYLTKEAIAHIRSLMLGREVWQPDREEYAPLTRELLDQVPDVAILDWISKPDDYADPDTTGVFDDIIEAIQRGGVRMLEMAGRDQVTQRYIEAITSRIEAVKHEWRGERLCFYVTWNSLRERLTAYEEAVGDVDTDLQNLVAAPLDENYLEPRVDDLPDWPDPRKPENECYLDEASMEVLELKRPEDPNQLPLLPESFEDDAPTKEELLANVPVSAENEIKHAAETVCRANHSDLVAFSAKMEKSAHTWPHIDFDFQVDPPFAKEAELEFYLIIRKTAINALAQNGLVHQASFVSEWKPEEGILGMRVYVYRVNEPNWRPPTQLEYLEQDESIVSNQSPAGVGA